MTEGMDVVVGTILEGKVSGIQSYGAFVSFADGTHGLIHISEISERFVRKIEDYLHVNDNVRVKIIGFDDQKKFYRLSLKQLNDRERQFIRKPPVLKPRRQKVPMKSQDFTALAKNLPQWIEDALQKGDKYND